MTDQGGNTITGTVLVMDDQEMLREVAAAMLEELGYGVVTAEDGEQAVAHYQQALQQGTPFDLVIMDLTVPGGMGGEDAARQILELDGCARIMVCSGHANDDMVTHYQDCGFCGVISKPYNYEQLAAAIRSIMPEQA